MEVFKNYKRCINRSQKLVNLYLLERVGTTQGLLMETSNITFGPFLTMSHRFPEGCQIALKRTTAPSIWKPLLVLAHGLL
ncbi:hypothetical protein GDO78_008573 [Eleutherodactylus coqui]|uniref:Uncharacterized protein n=1 Tax=Eleutherodactylus coqui TaxID=57060 RepID=A0A8J6FDW5_ELECQ|nr:hypothetical protein GDO78_008573 [Eleutherodactylus coqui]